MFIKSQLCSHTRGQNIFRVHKVYFQNIVGAGYVKHDIISVGNVMVEENPAVCFSGVKLMDHLSL